MNKRLKKLQERWFNMVEGLALLGGWREFGRCMRSLWIAWLLVVFVVVSDGKYGLVHWFLTLATLTVVIDLMIIRGYRKIVDEQDEVISSWSDREPVDYDPGLN